MTSALCCLLAALAVAPADRLAMADRLFNRGRYAEARAEYSALKGEKALAPDELLYRFAECDRLQGSEKAARATYAELLAKYPASRHADRARLMHALSGTDAERRTELKVLDSDRVAAPTRAAALYHLGILDNDAAALGRAAKLDPKGRYADSARIRQASILANSKDAEESRRAVALLLEIAFGPACEYSEQALYLAAATSYGAKRYDEAGSLFRRYLKAYPAGAFAREATSAGAWCCYLNGRHADALALCGEAKTDDLAYLRAAATAASGDKAAADRLFRQYLLDHPQGRYRAEAELPLARLEFEAAEKTGDAAKAVESARRAAALGKTAADRLRLAWALEKSGQVAEALAEYAAVARDFAGTESAAEAMMRKAMVDLRAERWAAAELALKESLAGKLDTRRRGEALYWRGIAAVRLGHDAEGAVSLREAVKAGVTLDQSREARLVLADIDYRAGRTDESRKAYAELVREGAVERMGAAKTLAVGRLLGGEEAKVCAKALIAGKTDAWRQNGYALLAETEETAKNFTAAIAAYREALKVAVTTECVPHVTWRLGVLETQAGDWTAADATLRKAVELNSSDSNVRAECYVRLAEAAVGRNDIRSARAYATVVTTLFENTPFATDAAAILKAHPEEAK